MKKMMISSSLGLFTLVCVWLFISSEFFYSFGGLFIKYFSIFLIIITVLFSVPFVSTRLERSFKTLNSYVNFFPPFLLFISTLLIFGSLFSLWGISAGSQNYTIGGVLPLVDSKDYYLGALSLNELGHLSEWASRRPLNHIFFGSLFYLGKMNHYNTFIILGFILTSVSFMFSYLVSLRVGRRASVYVLLAITYFIAPYWGSFLSESFGLIFGLMGLSLLFISITEKKTFNFFIAPSIAFICVALSGRSGNYLAPFVILFCLLVTKDKIKKKISLFLICVASLLFSLNVSNFVRSFYGVKGTAFSNFGITVYGVVRGGEGWTQFSKDNPHLNDVSPEVRAKALSDAILDSISSEPVLAIKGLVKGMKLYAFRFSSFLPSQFKFVEVILFLIIVFYFFKNRRRYDLKSEPLLLTVLAVCFSNALVAPVLSQDGEQRVFAATIIFNAALLCYGFRFVVRKEEDLGAESSIGSKIVVTSLCLILVGVMMIPITSFDKKEPLSRSSFLCGDNEKPISFRYHTGMMLKVRKEGASGYRDGVISHAKLVEMVSGTNLEELRDILVDERDFSLLSILDLNTESYRLIKVVGPFESDPRSVVNLCLIDKYIGYKVN